MTSQEEKALEALQAESHAISKRLYAIEQNQVRLSSEYLKKQSSIETAVRSVKSHLDTLNGRTGRMEEEVFGHNDHGTEGLKSQVDEMKRILERIRGGIWALSAVLAINGTLWFIAVN